jgi:pimeloyl-ACP methyl ester carboxylesterase
MSGLDPEGLARIVCPVTILTGSASEPFYAPIAGALEARIPGARHVELAGLRHTAPIIDPAPIAAAVRAALGLPIAVVPGPAPGLAAPPPARRVQESPA